MRRGAIKPRKSWLGINGAPAAYSGATYQQAIATYVNLLNLLNLPPMPR